LKEIELFAEDDDCANKDKHGASGVDRAGDGDWEMLHAEIAENPRSEDDKRLQKNVEMVGGHTAETEIAADDAGNNNRGEKKRTEKGVEKQHRQDIIAGERNFLENIVETEAKRRNDSEEKPHDELQN